VDWKDEKVLITGGSGFLGANLIHFLVAEKHVPQRSVRSFAHRQSHALDDLPGVEQRLADILDLKAVTEACADRTLVFHTAGSTTFDPRLRKQQWLVNVEGTRNVLEAVSASRTVRRLCHTSTVNVLGCPSPAGSHGTEETCNPYTSRPRLHSFASAAEALALADAVHAGCAPRDWWKRVRIGYFSSKLAAQELVNRAALGGLDVVSVLPGTFFGPYDEFFGPSAFLLAILHNAIRAAPRGGLPLAHVHDIARGHVLAVEKGRPGSVYIVSGKAEDNRPYRDMFRIIAEALRQKEPHRAIATAFPIIPPAAALAAAAVVQAWAALRQKPAALSIPAARASAHLFFYSSGKAERELGYVAERRFREGVEEMYASMKGGGATHEGVSRGRSWGGAPR
jgi:dihydroflavonol-4-reductase